MDNIVITITPFTIFLTIAPLSLLEIYFVVWNSIMKPQFIEFETLMMQYLLENLKLYIF